MAYREAIEALADPTRRAVFERLRAGPQPVGRIADGLDVSRPAVSQHLKVLEGAGLVTARKEGTRRIYSVEVGGLVELRRYLDGFWGHVLDSFGEDASRAPKVRTARARRSAADSRRKRAQ
jgi:DNA-binding transcriptional ArsR family regulator